MNNLNCGDRVRYKPNPRHVGVVLSINSGTAQVRWEESGWISFAFAHALEKAN